MSIVCVAGGSGAGGSTFGRTGGLAVGPNRPLSLEFHGDPVLNLVQALVVTSSAAIAGVIPPHSEQDVFMPGKSDSDSDHRRRVKVGGQVRRLVVAISEPKSKVEKGIDFWAEPAIPIASIGHEAICMQMVDRAAFVTSALCEHVVARVNDLSWVSAPFERWLRFGKSERVGPAPANILRAEDVLSKSGSGTHNPIGT